MALPGGSMTDSEVKSQSRVKTATAESWSSLSDTEKSETLEKLDTKSQVELWTQIGSSEDKANFLKFLNDQDSKIKFWSSMSQKL